jgi:hypothetical protein
MLGMIVPYSLSRITLSPYLNLHLISILLVIAEPDTANSTVGPPYPRFAAARKKLEKINGS